MMPAAPAACMAAQAARSTHSFGLLYLVSLPLSKSRKQAAGRRVRYWRVPASP